MGVVGEKLDKKVFHVIWIRNFRFTPKAAAAAADKTDERGVEIRNGKVSEPPQEERKKLAGQS